MRSFDHGLDVGRLAAAASPGTSSTCGSATATSCACWTRSVSEFRVETDHRS